MKRIRTSITAAVRHVCSRWPKHAERWEEACRTISEARERWKDEAFGFAFDLGRSPLFTLVRRPLFRQEIRAYREGVTVTATYRGGILLLRPVLATAAFLFLVLSLALSTGTSCSKSRAPHTPTTIFRTTRS